MAYTPPAGNAVAFVQGGLAYSPPAGNAADFSFVIGGNGAVVLSFSASNTGEHGVVGAGGTAVAIVPAISGICGPLGRSSYADVVMVADGSGRVDGYGNGAGILSFATS